MFYSPSKSSRSHTAMITILGIDLGQFKSVACSFDPYTQQACHAADSLVDSALSGSFSRPAQSLARAPSTIRMRRDMGKPWRMTANDIAQPRREPGKKGTPDMLNATPSFAEEHRIRRLGSQNQRSLIAAKNSEVSG